MFHVRDKDKKPACVCVYCEKPGHKSSECELVSEPPERKMILSKKRLCFNCTGPKHRASDYHSNKTCANCKGKHHTSICEKTSNVLVTTNDNHVTYPLVTDIEGIKCRALIDTGAGASFASSTLTDRINKKPIRKQYKRIKTIMGSSTKSIAVYSVEIQDSDHEFKFQTEIDKLEKSVLLELPNPEYQNLQNSYQHLKDIKINDHDKKLETCSCNIRGERLYQNKDKRETEGGASGGVNRRTNKIRLGYFITC